MLSKPPNVKHFNFNATNKTMAAGSHPKRCSGSALTFRWFLFLPGVLLMSRSTVDWVRRSSQTEHTRKKPRHGQVQEDKQEVRRQGKRTDGVVEGLPRLLVPDEGGLSLVGHPDGCGGVTRSRDVTLWNSGLLVVSTSTRVPLMLEMSTLSCVSFSHVRSIHSYTDCRISLGSSSTHLEDQRHVTSCHVTSRSKHPSPMADFSPTLLWGSSA